MLPRSHRLMTKDVRRFLTLICMNVCNYADVFAIEVTFLSVNNTVYVFICAIRCRAEL